MYQYVVFNPTTWDAYNIRFCCILLHSAGHFQFEGAWIGLCTTRQFTFCLIIRTTLIDLYGAHSLTIMQILDVDVNFNRCSLAAMEPSNAYNLLSCKCLYWLSRIRGGSEHKSIVFALQSFGINKGFAAQFRGDIAYFQRDWWVLFSNMIAYAVLERQVWVISNEGYIFSVVSEWQRCVKIIRLMSYPRYILGYVALFRLDSFIHFVLFIDPNMILKHWKCAHFYHLVASGSLRLLIRPWQTSVTKEKHSGMCGIFLQRFCRALPIYVWVTLRVFWNH